MAYAESQPHVSLTAGSTFATSDLYKFVQMNGSGQVIIGGSTAAVNVVGTLLGVTATTGGAGSETVTVGLLQGIGKLQLAASTVAAGGTIAASSAGLGIAPTTDAIAVGYLVDGSSGAAGRIGSVLFSYIANA